MKSKILSASSQTQDLREALVTCFQLLGRVRHTLSSHDRKTVDIAMASLPKSLLNGTPSFAGEKPTSPCTLSPTHEPSSLTPERYHGEASDIRFVKTMKLALHTTDYHGSPEPTRADETIDSYEQDNSFRPEPVDLEGRFLPNQQIARTYLDIYLSTIHIAYPFVESSQLSQLHVEFWKSDSLGVVPAPWLSILCEFSVLYQLRY